MKPPYRLLKVIGQGGFAEVWRARSRERPDEIVALKRPLTANETAKKRMRREILIQRKYAGPHVMPILDADEDEGEPWFAMPVAEGNLHGLWTSGALGHDREAIAMAVLSAAADGLRAAHADDVVHRDLTPTNVLAMPDQNATGGRLWVVADWGLVRRRRGTTSVPLTGTGQRLGTDGFAAPETLSDAHRVEVTADVYSVGRILAWLLTGDWPKGTLRLAPATGPWRSVVTAATEIRPTDRPAGLDELLGLANRATAAPVPISPRHQMRALVDSGPSTDVDAEELRRLARHHRHDERLYLDELARLNLRVVKDWSKRHPDDAAEAAQAMCDHLMDADWSGRDYNAANLPLLWAFTVLTTLVERGKFDLAEDVATRFFRSEERWDRYEQLGRTRRWMQRLTDPAGAIVAQAIRNANAIDYYRREVGSDRLASAALDAIIGQ